MASQPAPIVASHPSGYPAAFVAGRAISLSLFVPGEPVAKGRPKAKVITPKGGKPFPQFYTPKETADWEAHVAETVKEQVKAIPVQADQDFVLPFKECRILVVLRFNLTKPVSYPKRIIYPTKKPDSDNLEKAILDGLVLGRIIGDDALITDTMHFKRYASEEHPAGVEIDLTALPCEV